MIEQIVWIVPSRKRPEKLKRFLTSWQSCTSGHSVMVIGVDKDDHSYDNLKIEFSNVIWEVVESPNGSFLQIVNGLAKKYANEYSYIGFNEDDAIFKTPGYEINFIKKLKEIGNHGIVYANDLINKKGRIYFPVMDSAIIQKLGYMVPPILKCMYADDFWRDLGKSLGTVYRFEDIVIQHLHYTRDDNVADEISSVVNSNQEYDRIAYSKYIENDFQRDVGILKK